MSELSQTCCHLCGAEFTTEQIAKARSYPHLQRYFVKIRVAFENWPSSHHQTGEVIEFQPSSPAHLRKWLQVQAGYDEKTTIVIDATKKAEVKAIHLAAEAAIRTAGAHSFVEVHGCVLVIRSSKSIRYTKLGQKTFSELDKRVSDVVWSVTGLDPDELMKGQSLRESPWQSTASRSRT